MGTGTPLIQHGRHGLADSRAVALVLECGQHFLRSSGELATRVALNFLAHFGLLVAAERKLQLPPPQRYGLLKTCLVKTPEFRFVRTLLGFEVFAEGELIATDGAEEIRAPCADCTVLMPTREPIVGREAVYLTRLLN